MTLQVKSRHCYACSPFPGATKNGTSMQRGPDCQYGVVSHRSYVGLSTIARREGSDKSARAATPIFIHNGAPQALEGCYVGSAAYCAGGRQGRGVTAAAAKAREAASLAGGGSGERTRRQAPGPARRSATASPTVSRP